MIKVGVVGGSGYTGLELIRLLLSHPSVEIIVITSRTEKDRKISDVFPSLRGLTNFHFFSLDDKKLKK